jgi:hypothetical protein
MFPPRPSSYTPTARIQSTPSDCDGPDVISVILNFAHSTVPLLLRTSHRIGNIPGLACYSGKARYRPTFGTIASNTDGSETELSDLRHVSEIDWTTVREIRVEDVEGFHVHIQCSALRRERFFLKANLRVCEAPEFATLSTNRWLDGEIPPYAVRMKTPTGDQILAGGLTLKEAGVTHGSVLAFDPLSGFETPTTTPTIGKTLICYINGIEAPPIMIECDPGWTIQEAKRECCDRGGLPARPYQYHTFTFSRRELSSRESVMNVKNCILLFTKIARPNGVRASTHHGALSVDLDIEFGTKVGEIADLFARASGRVIRPLPEVYVNTAESPLPPDLRIDAGVIPDGGRLCLKHRKVRAHVQLVPGGVPIRKAFYHGQDVGAVPEAMGLPPGRYSVFAVDERGRLARMTGAMEATPGFLKLFVAGE